MSRWFTLCLATFCLTCILGGQASLHAEDPANSGVTPAGAERLQLRLLGTLTAPDSGIAICLNPATGNAIRLRVGESFEGWILRSVHGHEATFEKTSQRTVLELTSSENGQALPAPPQVTGTVQPVHTPVSAPASGRWMDGDGQMIAPPRKSK